MKRSREKFHDERTSVAHDSHTKYTHLQRDELVERLRNCQKEKRSLKSKCIYHSAQIKKIIRKEGVKISEGDSDDLSKLIEVLSPKVENEFDKDSPQYMLWREQAKYNSLKTKQQMRWHPLIIRFALSLHYSSRAAYHMVTKSGFLSLPSERTLRDYSHWCTTQNGVNYDFLKQARKVLEQEGVKSDDQRQYILLLDEMKVKTGLVFSKSSGELVGFSDLGSVNRDIENLLSKNSADSPHTLASLAKKMLVFMIRPVFKPSLSFPVAAYPTVDLTGSQLFPVIWEVIEALELDNFPVVAVTADGASPNRNFFRICGKKKRGCIPFKPEIPMLTETCTFSVIHRMR